MNEDKPPSEDSIGPRYLLDEYLQRASAAQKEGVAKSLRVDPPERIYHYTTAQGLLGILDSQRLWATNAQYVSDAREVLHGAEIIESCVEELFGLGRSDLMGEFRRRVLATVNPLSEYLEAYIACFCEEGDLLSQWRGYGGGTGGYSIGLKTRSVGMRWTDKTRQQEFALVKVMYEEDRQRRLVSEVIAPVWEGVHAIGDQQGPKAAYEAMPEACRFLTERLLIYFVAFKNPAFSEEGEWRAVQIRSRVIEAWTELRFRRVGTLIVPYVELDLSPQAGIHTGRLPVASLMHGPTAYPELAVKSLDLLIRKHDLPHAEVHSSKVPLRA